MQPNIRLGFLTHTEGTGTAYQIYQDTLALFAAADRLGFDVGWLAEHHFKPVAGRLPSLFPFLAAAAQRTCRIRLGVATLLLPYANPFRVAEDAAVVDTLSGGRLELGVGSPMPPILFCNSTRRRRRWGRPCEFWRRSPPRSHRPSAGGLPIPLSRSLYEPSD